jgi:hypothetical protein
MLGDPTTIRQHSGDVGMNRELGTAAVKASDSVETAVDQEALAEELQCLLDLLEDSDVEGARRYVKELEIRWPESERVRHYAHVLAPPTVQMRSDIKARPLDREWEWLRLHGHEHPGCWLAVLGDQLIAADLDYHAVRARAREVPGEERPLIYHQPAPRKPK